MSISNALQWRTRTLLSRVREARAATTHDGLYGENNEGLLIDTLRELLPADWDVGSGEVLDVEGRRSPQCDVIIYNRRILPTAYVGPTGRVSVLAHAVGGIVEVKSLLHSGPEVLDLARQGMGLQSFVANAIKTGRDHIMREASEQDVNEDVTIELDAICAGQPSVWGFAYGADVQFPSIQAAMPLEPDVPQVFVLDVPRAWADIRPILAALGDDPKKEDVIEFAEAIRRPNGYSFSVDNYTTGSDVTFQACANAHGADTLRVFVKEISDLIRRVSTLRTTWSPRATEVVYSAYNPWANTYA